MCNIAGYVGNRQAAPILVEMMRREEGFAGGYFTGIATLHEGRIHYAKLTGNLDRLTALTEAAKLPGNVGIIHSRSNSGGGDEWSHPFIGLDGSEPVLAYVANGSAGCFAHRTEEYTLEAEALIQEGYRMLSRVEIEGNRYNRMADGTSVHMSDLMCQLILRELRAGRSLRSSMAEAFCSYPSEIVGLCIARGTAETIAWARINMPMAVGYAPHGAYLASTALAFPEDAGEPIILPANSSGYVTASGMTSNPFEAPPAKIAPLDSCVRAAVYARIEAMLAEGEQPFGLLRKALKELFCGADCYQLDLAAYEALYALARAGRLETRVVRVPGAASGLDAPQILMRVE